MLFKHKEKKISKSEQRFNDFMGEYKAQRFGTPQPPPTRIVRDGGTRICHCAPKKSHPNPPHITTYISPDKDERVFNMDMGLEMEKIMVADTVRGILKEHKEKDTSQYSIVTKDEYILNFIKRFGGNKERATESFKNISQGYNFIFTIGDNQYYSVDYINKLLER